MQRLSTTLALITMFLSLGAVAEAATLEDRQNQWVFSLAAVDTDNAGTFTEYSFGWSWIFEDGRHQLGVTVSAFDNDFDDPLLADSDGATIGPTYQWNWTPGNDRATGYLLANISSVGGDLGDVFDSSATLGIGVKAFIGNSAAVVVLYAFDQFQGASGFEDVDQTRLVVGIGLYSHER